MTKWKIRTPTFNNALGFTKRVAILSKLKEPHVKNSLLRLGNGIDEGLYGISLSEFNEETCTKVIESYATARVRHEKLIKGILNRLENRFSNDHLVSVITNLHVARVDAPQGWIGAQNINFLATKKTSLTLRILSESPAAGAKKYFSSKLLIAAVAAARGNKPQFPTVVGFQYWPLCAMYAMLLKKNACPSQALSLLFTSIQIDTPVVDWATNGNKCVSTEPLTRSLDEMSAVLYSVGEILRFHTYDAAKRCGIQEYLIMIGHNILYLQQTGMHVSVKCISEFLIAVAACGMTTDTVLESQQKYSKYLPESWSILLIGNYKARSFEDLLAILLGTVKNSITDRDLNFLRITQDLRPAQYLRRGYIIRIIISLVSIKWQYRGDYTKLFQAVYHNHYNQTKLNISDMAKLSWSLSELYVQFGSWAVRLISSFCRNLSPAVAALLHPRRNKVLGDCEAAVLLKCFDIHCTHSPTPASEALRDGLRAACEGMNELPKKPDCWGEPPHEYQPY